MMRAVTSQYGFTKAFYIEAPGVYKVERPLISFPPPWSFDFIPPPAQRTFDFLPFTRNCMDSIAFLWIFFCISLHFTQFFLFDISLGVGVQEGHIGVHLGSTWDP